MQTRTTVTMHSFGSPFLSAKAALGAITAAVKIVAAINTDFVESNSFIASSIFGCSKIEQLKIDPPVGHVKMDYNF
ncbi:MAG: hypothetical protein ACK41P_00305 [Asticcacaulis sp.]